MKDTGKVNIHGKEYETVASRVQRFRTDHPKLSLETVIVERNDKEVVIRAIISDGDVRLATGFAEEQRQSSTINRTSALENAETSAIGRALAAFGYGGTEYASADEVAQAIGQQSAPNRPTPPAKPIETTERATATQKARMTALLRGRGVDDGDMRGILAGDYGVDTDTMSKTEADRVIEEIQS